MNRHKQHVMRLVRSRQAEKRERSTKIDKLNKELIGWTEIQMLEPSISLDIIVSSIRAKLAELGA